jgi:hypothetical protein
VLAAIVGISITALAPKAEAQVGVQIGVAPDCPYGYYDVPPYNCAPAGYYGPEWFVNGVFIGAGPWFHGPAEFHGYVSRGAFAIVLPLWIALPALAQDNANRSAIPPPAVPPAAPVNAPAVPSKWKNFADETFTPLFLAAGAFNASLSQATNSDPRYGVGAGAWAERFGASNADNLTQNFFGDFVMASAFHENVIYMRRGPAYGGIWKRAGYAISRALVTGADRGGDTFNWSNVTGTAMSAGFANLYYPAASRTSGATAIHFATSLAGSGFANLFPEFWPDFRAMLERHHLFPRGR